MKKVFSTVMVILLLLVTTQPAFALSDADVHNRDVSYAWSVINSNNTKEIIIERIDFDKLGTQTVYIGNGVAFEYFSAERTNLVTRAYSVKSGTMSGRFYLTSNGQTVANYSLAVTFHYDGTHVYADEADIQVSCSAIPNWSIIGSHSTSSGSGWFSVDASYLLYNNNNYNNDTFLDMSCDARGNITKNYE